MPLFLDVIMCHYMSLYAAELNVRQAGWWSELDVICHNISLYAIICQYMTIIWPYIIICHNMSLYSEYRYMSLYGHNIVTYGGVNCHNIVASSRILQEPLNPAQGNHMIGSPMKKHVFLLSMCHYIVAVLLNNTNLVII